MTDEEIIALLNEDIALEHQAIIQYLLSAWMLGGEVGGSIESIARDEMRHFKFFARAVRALGGTPTMERKEEVRLTDPVEMIRANAQAEDEAVKTYRKHQAMIPREEVKRLYERIIGDEEYHRESFRHMMEKVEQMEPVHFHEPQTPKERLLFRYLEEDIAGEYAAILRYLHQSFVVEDGWLSDALEDRAIEEMKHMGWLAEEKVEAGGEPELRPDPVKYTEDLQEIFEGNLKLEKAAEARYQRHIEGYDDPDMRRLWKHIQFQEEHHSAEFEARLKELGKPEEKPAEKKPPRSVGSLFRKPQS